MLAMGALGAEWWRGLWSWERVRDVIRTLPGRLGFGPGRELRFFGLRVSLEDGSVYDEVLRRYLAERERYGLYFVLYQYARAPSEVGEVGEYVTLSHVCPAMHCPMLRQNAEAFEEAFGLLFAGKPELLYRAAEPLGYERVEVGDAAVKVYALPRVPVVVGVWFGEEGIPPKAVILFDRSVSHYLDCEAASIVAGATLARLVLALSARLGLDLGDIRVAYRFQCAE